MSVTDPTSKKWYFKHKGEIFGPLPFSALREASFSGLLQPEDPVRVDGTTVWLRAESLNFWAKKAARQPLVRAEPGLPELAVEPPAEAAARATAEAAASAAEAEAAAAAAAAAAGGRGWFSRKRLVIVAAALFAVLVLAGAVGAWWWLRTPQTAAAPIRRQPVAAVVPPAPPDPRTLADNLRLGRGVARNAALAYAEYVKFAGQGDAAAQRWAGLYGLLDGEFDAKPDFFPREAQRWKLAQVPQSRVRQVTDAIAWLEKAAKQNDAAALYWLACVTHWGIGPVPDAARAMQLVKAAAGAGEPRANFAQAILAGRGVGMPADAAEMARCAERAAAGGCVPAQVLASRCYQEGRGVQKDLNRAASLVRTVADQGNPEAQYQYSRILRESQDRDQVARGRTWLEKAAAAGWPAAQLEWGLLRVQDPGGDPALIAEGVKLLERAADIGTPAVWMALAQLYTEGRRVTRDPGKAAAFADRVLAVDAGNVEGNAIVGAFLLDNRKDGDKALRCLLLAAWAGHSGAAWRLGRALYDGEVDFVRERLSMNARRCEAARWWKEAAWNGSVNSVLDLDGYSLQNLTVARRFNAGLTKAEEGITLAEARQMEETVTRLLTRVTILLSRERLDSWCDSSFWPEEEKAVWSYPEFWRQFLLEQAAATYPQVGGGVRFRLASGAEKTGVLQVVREAAVQISGKWFTRYQIHPDDWVLFDSDLQIAQLDARLAGQRPAKSREWRDQYERIALEKTGSIASDRDLKVILPAGVSRAQYIFDLLLIRRFMLKDAETAPELQKDQPAADEGKLVNLDSLLTDVERETLRPRWRNAALTCWRETGASAPTTTIAGADAGDWLPVVDRAFQP